MVSAINSANSYGNIQRIGISNDNRVIYRVIDSKGQDAGMMTVAQKDADTFEKSYIDIMSTAPKIKDYVEKNSSPEDITRRKNISRLCIGTGGIIGAITPFLFMKNTGTAKKILTSIAGIVAGLSAGFLASLSITTPPGAFKFAKATRNLSRVDIQPFKEATILQATRM